MSVKKYIFITSFILCVSAPAPTQPKTILIFFNVFFRPSETTIEQHVRSSLGLLRSIGLLFSGIPDKASIKHQLFSILEEIPLVSLPSHPSTWQHFYAPWDRDYRYPPILNQMITSASFEEEHRIYTQVKDHINTHSQLSKTYKIILTCIADFLFQSKRMNQALRPVEDIVHLLRQLRREGHTFILIAGAPGYAWDQFMHTASYAHIIQELFPPIYRYIAGKERLLPTSPQFFEKIIHDHQLHPEECVVIAHNPHDLAYAQSIGMKTVIYTPHAENSHDCRARLLRALKT